MPEPDERGHEARLSHVEHEVAELREETGKTRTDAVAARILAGAADRDVAEFKTELRAHTRTLNALRETQLEHQAECRQHRAESRQHLALTHQHIVETRQHMAETRAGFAAVNVGMAHIVSLIEGISDK